MSGFDMGWLALREPADKAARDKVLISDACYYLEKRDYPVIMDIGCGTGSTYRSLCGSLPMRTRWQLVDYDEQLLAEAGRLIGHANVTYHHKDLTDLSTLSLEGVDLMTASAFFDLCSSTFCEDLCERLAASRTGLYAALNFDGRITWTDGHPLDEPMVSAFNRHQRIDKGFGAALGPQASGHLVGAFACLGYRTEIAESIWSLTRIEHALQEAFVRGMVEPVVEMSELASTDIEDWLSFRLAKLDGGGRLEVGHIDLLAIPV
jgi:Methyltransferase domain